MNRYTYIPYDSDRRRRYRKQFLEVYDFSTEPFSGFFQGLLRDDRIGPTCFHHSGQRARHAQSVGVFGPHHEHVRRVGF